MPVRADRRTGLRQVHNGFHHAPGISRAATWLTLFGNSVLFAGFFAVWTVHHDCDEHVFARTLNARWKNFLTYNMFYHLEHHLFPGVPTIKLGKLAARIREQLPDLKAKEVF